MTSSPDDCDATHASSHNSILLINNPAADRARVKREKEFEERRARDEKLFAKGKLDKEVMDRRRDHDSAFLYPVMLYPYYGAYGYPMAMGGGCAVVAGGVMSGDGGAGAG